MEGPLLPQLHDIEVRKRLQEVLGISHGASRTSTERGGSQNDFGWDAVPGQTSSTPMEQCTNAFAPCKFQSVRLAVAVSLPDSAARAVSTFAQAVAHIEDGTVRGVS